MGNNRAVKTCMLEECDKEHKGHGYCQKHLIWARKVGLIQGVKFCQIEECSSVVFAKQYCGKHYARYHLGKDPTTPSSVDKRAPLIKGDFALVPLGGDVIGQFAIIDIEDLSRISQYNWFLSHGYPSRSVSLGGMDEGEKETIYQQRMHREIMGLLPYDEREIDHKDLNKLNNRKSNLRFCVALDNNRNKSLTSANKSGYKGVSWKAKNEKWCVQIQTGFGVQHIGLFTNKHEAAKAYNTAAIQYFGEFAWLNKIEGING